jgi:tetratricopeptide (TPR) repeat protein
LANVLFNSGRLDEALDAAQEALRLARAHGAVAPLAIAGSVVVPILLQQGRTSEARRRLNELLLDVSRAEAVAPRERTEALARLRLQQLTFLRRDNRLDDALIQASRTLTQLEDLPGVNEHLVAESYRERSTMAWAAGRYPEAVRDIKRAIQMFVEQGDEFAEISAWGNLGLIYYSMTEFDLAEEGIRRVIALAERLNARHHLTYAVDYLGAVYLMRGQLNLATSYFDRAVDLARSSGAFKDLCRIRSNRAVVRLYKGDYAEAIPDLEADLRFSEEQQLSGAVLMDCICLSLCYLELEQRDRALRLAERSMKIANTQENAVFQTLALRCLAEHRPEKRLDLLHRALDLARQNQRPLDEAGCLLSLVGLTGCRHERAKLWGRGVQILEEIGATGWLAGASPDAPPRVIILM